MRSEKIFNYNNKIQNVWKTKIRTKTKFNKQKTVKKKVVDFILNMSIFILNINGLNTPNKRQR